MKKFKKLSAILMASIITAGTVSSMSAGAMAWISSKEYMDKQLEDAYMIPVDSFMSWSDVSDWYANQRIYLAETEHHNIYDYYAINGVRPDSISAEVNADIDDEALTKAIAEICPQIEYIAITPSAEENYRCISVAGVDVSVHPRYNAYDDTRKKDLTYEQAIEIYKLLDSIGELQKFEYKQEEVWSGGTRTSLTTYSGKGDIELIENYIAENNLDWCIDYDTCDVSFEEDLSPEECYKIAEQIYNDLGVYPSFPIPCSSTSYEGITIEMHNNIKGDANDDGQLALSDAVAILQSIGNPDEYQLTPQGKYNADVTGDYDGITNKDALTIQRRLLGLE